MVCYPPVTVNSVSRAPVLVGTPTDDQAQDFSCYNMYDVEDSLDSNRTLVEGSSSSSDREQVQARLKA
jgi:hypothetical protein